MSTKHHDAWLESHPMYDWNWLRQAIEAGFEVHHIDNDPENNDPSNLLMVECNDHLKIHRLIYGKKNRNNGWFNLEERVGRGQVAYERRSSSEDTWKKIGNDLGIDGASAGTKAVALAKSYAVYHGKKWPLPHALSCSCIYCKKKRKSATKAEESKH